MANMTFGVNLIPHNNTPTGSNTYTLGNSSYKWKLYADELNGQPLASMTNLYYVEGPSSDTTGGTWTGTITGLSAYYDGLTVMYIPAVAGGASGTTLNLNSKGAISCYNANNNPIDDQYKAGTPVLLVYKSGKWLQSDNYILSDQDQDTIAQLVGSMDEELPAAYKRVKGLTFNNNGYFAITNFKLQGSDTLRFKFSADVSCNVLGCYTDSSAQTNYSLYVATTSGSYLRYDGGAYNSAITAGETYNMVITPTGATGLASSSTWTAKTFTAASDFCIGTTSASAASSKLVGTLYGNIVVDGRAKFIPCERLSDHVLGYYNLNSSTFYTATGTAPTSIGYDISHTVQGKLIASTTLNANYTLTITYTDGTTYTTGSIRGADGTTPAFSIGTVTSGTTAAATITGTSAAPVLNLTLPKGDDANILMVPLTKVNNTTYRNTSITGAQIVSAISAGKTVLAQHPDCSAPFIIKAYNTDAYNYYYSSGNHRISRIRLTNNDSNSSTFSYTNNVATLVDYGTMNTNIQSWIKFPCYIDVTQDITAQAKTILLPIENQTYDYGGGLEYLDPQALIDYVIVGNSTYDRPLIIRKSHYAAYDSPQQEWDEGAGGYITAYWYQVDGYDFYSLSDWNIDWILLDPNDEETGVPKYIFKFIGTETENNATKLKLCTWTYYYDTVEGEGVETLTFTDLGGSDLAIGTVTTGAAGSSAAASITPASGSTPAQLNLTIPRGDQGPQGDSYLITAQDKQDIADLLEDEFVDDTGWVSIATADFTSSVDTATTWVAMKRVGCVVTITGVIRSKNAMAHGDTINVCTIPAQFRPPQLIRSPTGATYTYWTFDITTDGVLKESNYANTTATKSNRFYATYLVSGGMLSSGLTEVHLTGATQTVTAEANTRYICDTTITSLSFTPPSSGITDIIFTTGSTLPVTTFPSTVKFPEWFEVETEKTYEINILNGVYAVVGVWEA